MTLQIGIIGTGWFSKVHADILARMEGVDEAGVTGGRSGYIGSMACNASTWRRWE